MKTKGSVYNVHADFGGEISEKSVHLIYTGKKIYMQYCDGALKKFSS